MKSISEFMRRLPVGAVIGNKNGFVGIVIHKTPDTITMFSVGANHHRCYRADYYNWHRMTRIA